MYNKSFADQTKKASKTFHTLSLFFPKKVREDVFTLYAFVRTGDDLVDSEPPQKNAFEQYKNTTRKALSGKKTDDVLIDSFAEVVYRKKIPHQLIEDFFSGLSLDLSPREYATRGDLSKFLYGVAGVIGHMMCFILDIPKKSYKTAEIMGNALQMVNIIRDIAEDYARWKRIYIPKTVRKEYKWTWPFEKQYAYDYKSIFSAMVRNEIDYAYVLLDEAKEKLGTIPKEYRVPVIATWNVYFWVLKKIEKNPLIIFEKKVRPGKFTLFRYLLQSYFEVYIHGRKSNP